LSKKKTIGFISANLNNPYKGLHILIEALNPFVTNYPKNSFDLLLVGNGDVPMSSGNFGIRRVISGSDEEMISIINEMDLLVVPSIEDNSPSVIGEAVAAGVPVIGSRVGGITELLAEMDLPLFQPGDSLDLERVLSLFFQGRITFSVEKVQRDAIRLFGSDEFARKQIELYGKKSRI
jgi:glycosyltransferase involved in cell wall biosynthesis